MKIMWFTWQKTAPTPPSSGLGKLNAIQKKVAKIDDGNDVTMNNQLRISVPIVLVA